ncbi:methionine synthase reductase-like [Uranotaenia lowii]|uniref:methionine synthase reductase-like n=1 Tax=Uranotaenia lowii TaxID=190385 RepID=UPI00247B2C57|nr:methionine synthase reductase-like [Uranotaenia lowii]
MLDILDVINKRDSSVEIQLPPLPVAYIKLVECDDSTQFDTEKHLQVSCSQPFAATDVLKFEVVNHAVLAKGPDIKTVYDLTLETNAHIAFNHVPGDTVGILTENLEDEVNEVLFHLGLESKGDVLYSVEIDSNTKKKAAKLPLYIPERVQLRKLFTECLDLRAIPKKLFIRALLEHTSDSTEKQFMELLCDKKGTCFDDVILKKSIGFTALLRSLAHCVPPVSLLIEHLPRLMPRPYSIANYSLDQSTNSRLRIIFSLKEKLPGLTTKMLQSRCQTRQSIFLYFRKSTNFAYTTDDLHKDIILIGVGTGIAPYLGFLEKRSICKHESKVSLGNLHLYAGFRYEQKNFICRREVEDYFRENPSDSLHVAFSRDENSKHRYVQDLLEHNKDEVFRHLSNGDAKIYVCGDGKTMLPQIFEKMKNIYAHFANLDAAETQECFVEFKKNGRYVEDVWL